MSDAITVALIALIGVLATAWVQWQNGKTAKYKASPTNAIDMKDQELAAAHAYIRTLLGRINTLEQRSAGQEGNQ